jgi:alcohol dehydrogenase
VRAVVFFEHGGPEVLQVVEDWPAPVAAPGEVVVDVRACGLNHLDIFVRRGMPGVHTRLPHISGGDIAGVVASIGADVAGVQPGDRVLVDPAIDLGNGHVGALGESVQGGLCAAIAVPATSLIALPASVSFEQAAALPIAYGTAYRMLFTRGQVVAGEVVVVLGASGGVGTACVQLAKRAGASVIAVASTDDKLQRLGELGADHLIRARGAEFGAEVWRLTDKRGADVIVDYTGKETWPTSIRSLKMGGRLLTCGATTGFEAVTDLRYVWVREQTIVGSDGWRRADLEALLRLVQDGQITPVIDRVWPLERTREAESAMEQRGVFGKIIIVP